MFKGKVFLTSSRIGILKFVSLKVDFLQEFNEIIISSFKIRNFLIQFEAVILDSEVISGGDVNDIVVPSKFKSPRFLEAVL